MTTAAIVPAYNEQETVAAVVEGCRQFVDEVFVIDDGSTDETAKRAASLGAVVISQGRHAGLGRAIAYGMREILSLSKAVIFVQIDADGQYDPKEIPAVLDLVRRGEADMVLGSRMERIQYNMPALRKSGNRAFTRILRRMTGQDVQDGQTGFRALRRQVIERCLPINEFSYTQEMIIRAAKEGFVIKSVPITFYRRQGESRLFQSPFSYARHAWWIIIRTWRDYHPFKFFVIPGIGFLALAGVSAGFVGWHLYQTHAITGRVGTLIVSGVLFLFGMQLIFLGILADMIRTHTKY